MKKYSMNMSCKGLYNEMEKGNINFDCAVQRNKVWDVSRKSLLIHSILYGYQIPSFYLVKNEDGTFDSLDGKQRSNAIYDFMNDEYLLTADFPIVYDDNEEEYDFSGLKYSELPEWAQDTIKDYMLSVFYFEDMTEQEISEFFFRLNNGKPLTAVDLTRVKAKSAVQFDEIGKNPAVQATLSDKAKANRTHFNIATQIYAMLHMKDLDFGTKAFRPYIADVDVSKHDMEEINAGLDAVGKIMARFMDKMNDQELDEVEQKHYKRVVRKLKSRTHFVSISYLAILAVKKENFDIDKFEEVVFDFFNTTKTTTSEEYNKCVGAGSAKPMAVQARKKVMDELYENEFAA